MFGTFIHDVYQQILSLYGNSPVGGVLGQIFGFVEQLLTSLHV